jgi:prepilin peptidase CpaA
MCGGLFLVCAILGQTMTSIFAYSILLVFPAILIVAALCDLLTMTIPNRLSLVLLVLFPVAAFVGDLSMPMIGWHVAAGAGILVLGFSMFALGWIGGGDAKLAAVMALWLGPFVLLEWTLLFAAIGGMLAMMILSSRHLPLPLSLANREWISRLHDPRTGVPYGIALAGAGLLIFPHSGLFSALS